MGGASTEIAFKATPESASEPFYTKEVLFDKAHSIYARSYLCYGHVEAWARFLGHLVHKHVSEGCGMGQNRGRGRVESAAAKL